MTSPNPLSEDWTPEAVVDGRPQAKAKEQVEDFRGELEDCEVFLEMGDRAAKMGIDLKITKSRIAELKKLIEKAEKKVPERVSAAELTLLQENIWSDTRRNRHAQGKQRRSPGRPSCNSNLHSRRRSTTGHRNFRPQPMRKCYGRKSGKKERKSSRNDIKRP